MADSRRIDLGMHVVSNRRLACRFGEVGGGDSSANIGSGGGPSGDHRGRRREVGAYEN